MLEKFLHVKKDNNDGQELLSIQASVDFRANQLTKPFFCTHAH